MNHLKPCPFCGGEAEIWTDGYGEWGLVSHRAGCLFPQYPNHHIQKADFDAWNTRAEVAFVPGFTTATDSPPTRYVPERTCRVEGSCSHDYGYALVGTVWEWDLSCGHTVEGGWPPDYCPNCGAKVEQPFAEQSFDTI